LAIATHFKKTLFEAEDLKEAICECELPVELRELLVKFCSATYYDDLTSIHVFDKADDASLKTIDLEST